MIYGKGYVVNDSFSACKMIIVYKSENVNVLTQISNNKGSVYRDVEDLRIRVQLGFLRIAFFYGEATRMSQSSTDMSSSLRRSFKFYSFNVTSTQM